MSRPFGRAFRCIVRRDDEMDEEERIAYWSLLPPPTEHVPEVKYALGCCGCPNSSALNRKTGRFDVGRGNECNS